MHNFVPTFILTVCTTGVSSLENLLENLNIPPYSVAYKWVNEVCEREPTLFFAYSSTATDIVLVPVLLFFLLLLHWHPHQFCWVFFSFHPWLCAHFIRAEVELHHRSKWSLIPSYMLYMLNFLLCSIDVQTVDIRGCNVTLTGDLANPRIRIRLSNIYIKITGKYKKRVW